MMNSISVKYDESCSLTPDSAIGGADQGMAIELQPVADEAIAKAAGNRLLEFFDLLVAEFDELAGGKSMR